jgi:type VI secretion system protein ImpM
MAARRADLVPGWYGKMPCLGDFASRRLGTEFIERWDAWLQGSLAASREALGESWLELFLNSPMWRFVLTPGICGENAWAGLLVPSVDKVGRYFPLTFALELAGKDATISAVFAAQAWFRALEQVGLAALDALFSPEQLEAALQENPFTVDTRAPDSSSGEALLAWARGGERSPYSLQVADPASLTAVVDASARALLSAALAGRSFWWSVAAEEGATELHCARGLPPESYFEVLLRGADAAQAMNVDVQVLQI